MSEVREYFWAYLTAARSAYSQAKAIWGFVLAGISTLALLGFSWASPSLLPIWAAPAWFASYLAFFLLVSLPYRMWKLQKAEITRLTLPQGPIPDMPIRELFDLVGGTKDFLDPHTEGWRKIGMAILDRLATGQLIGWGRSHQGRIAPLAEIRRDYWRSAQWSYYFLANDEDEMHQGPHVWPLFNTLDQGERYFDVRVNRVQASRIWPRRQTRFLTD